MGGQQVCLEMLTNNIGRVDIGWVVKALSNVLVLLVSLSTNLEKKKGLSGTCLESVASWEPGGNMIETWSWGSSLRRSRRIQHLENEPQTYM